MTTSIRPKREKALVLVVDDFPDTLELTTEYLEFKGYDVKGSADGLEALRLAEELLPDVMLLDISLPGLDGLEITKRLKAGAATKAIRVIAFTAHALQSKENEARSAGCDGFVTKPVVPEIMAAEIERVLSGASKPVRKSKKIEA